MVPTGPLTPMPKLLASDPGLFHLGPSHLVPLLLVRTGPAVPPLPEASCLCPNSAQALAHGAFYLIGKGLRKQALVSVAQALGSLRHTSEQLWAGLGL